MHSLWPAFIHKSLQDIKISTDEHCNTFRLVSLANKFPGKHWECNGMSVLKNDLDSIYAPVTFGHMLTGKAFSRPLRGFFLAELAIFALIFSNTITNWQSKLNEWNRKWNKSRMNETENNQIEESESTNECPFNLIWEEFQESKKSPNCLTNSDLQELEVLYNNLEELENDKIQEVIEKLKEENWKRKGNEWKCKSYMDTQYIEVLKSIMQCQS